MRRRVLLGVLIIWLLVLPVLGFIVLTIRGEGQRLLEASFYSLPWVPAGYWITMGIVRRWKREELDDIDSSEFGKENA